MYLNTQPMPISKIVSHSAMLHQQFNGPDSPFSRVTTMLVCTGECKVDSQVLTILLKEIRYKVSAPITLNVSWHAMLTEHRCKSLNCTISIQRRYRPYNKEFSGDVQYH